MACSNCNQSAPNTKCGCKDQPLTTPFNPTPNVSCPDPTPCYETIQDTCVKHSLNYGIADFGYRFANGDDYPELSAGATLEQAYQAMSVQFVNTNCLPPISVHPTYIDTTSIVLAWENTGAQFYNAAIATNSVGPFTPTPASSALSYTFTLLNPGTKYYFRVISSCSGGSQYSYSATITVTTLPAL
jgi:hypothetical protein